ncbi:MAG: F-box protein [Candidatus Paracaedibacteraceae bacterium]|nr:F-box protein [Candidatus Paracaedibacteraceae bacterium]
MKHLLSLIILAATLSPLSSQEHQNTYQLNCTDIIPSELFVKIFSYLDKGDQVGLKTVCKTFHIIASDTLLLGPVTPISIRPTNGNLIIPSVYQAVQIIGDTLPQTLESWGEYPSIHSLSITTTSQSFNPSQIFPHFPNIEYLYIQTPWQLEPSVSIVENDIMVETTGFSFANILPFPIARLTVLLFQNGLQSTLSRFRTIPSDILLETALTLDLAATKAWRLIGLGKTHPNPDDIDYILMMVTAPCVERTDIMLKSRLKIMKMILGNDILSFREWDLFEQIKTLLKYSKNKTTVRDQLISTIADIAPHLRVSFIRSLSQLATTPDKLTQFIQLINSSWMTPQLKSFIALKMQMTILQTPHDELVRGKRQFYSTALRSSILGLKSEDKRRTFLSDEILEQL